MGSGARQKRVCWGPCLILISSAPPLPGPLQAAAAHPHPPLWQCPGFLMHTVMAAPQPRCLWTRGGLCWRCARLPWEWRGTLGIGWRAVSGALLLPHFPSPLSRVQAWLGFGGAVPCVGGFLRMTLWLPLCLWGHLLCGAARWGRVPHRMPALMKRRVIFIIKKCNAGSLFLVGSGANARSCVEQQLLHAYGCARQAQGGAC